MARAKPPDQISTKVLRDDFRSIRKRVQFEQESIPVYSYGDLVAGMVPVAIAEELNLEKMQTCQAAEFRKKVTHYCDLLQSGLDGVWIKVHDKRAIALVSARVWRSMPQPVQPPVELQPLRECQSS